MRASTIAPRLALALLAVAFGSFALSGCGPGLSQIQDYRIGGSVAGLSAGDQVVLENNNGDSLTVTANGPFRFVAPVANNTGYSVTMAAQPANETCSVTNGSGVASAQAVVNVAVVCSPKTFVVSGTVSGLLPDAQLVLENDGADLLTTAVNGSFAFETPVAYGGSFDVTVGTQPQGEICTVSGGMGGPLQAAPPTVSVLCAADTYTVGGTVGGLITSGLVLQNNGGDPLAVATGSGTFQFPLALASGAGYSVTVFQQPAGEVCTVTHGSSTVGNGDVTTVGVTCAAIAPTISCSANPAIVNPGESSTIESVASSAAGLPLFFSYSSTAGSISGSTSTATLNTVGVAPGTVTVECNVVDSHGNYATAMTEVTVLMP